MLTKLTVRNFMSLVDVTVEFSRLAVLFGPNAAGKSNLLDAVAALSGIGNVLHALRRARPAAADVSTARLGKGAARAARRVR